MIKSSVAEVAEVNTREEGGTVNNVDIKDLSENSDSSQLLALHCPQLRLKSFLCSFCL